MTAVWPHHTAYSTNCRCAAEYHVYVGGLLCNSSYDLIISAPHTLCVVHLKLTSPGSTCRALCVVHLNFDLTRVYMQSSLVWCSQGWWVCWHAGCQLQLLLLQCQAALVLLLNTAAVSAALLSACVLGPAGAAHRWRVSRFVLSALAAAQLSVGKGRCSCSSGCSYQW